MPPVQSLYDDFETDAAKTKRLAAEAKRAKKETGKKEAKGVAAVALTAGSAVLGEAGKKGGKRDGIFKVTVQDNGMGMRHDDIPNMLGRVLTGTKYGVQQARGKFGLGSKMALMWAMMSTGLPIEVRSATSGSSTLTYCKLAIDIEKNEPDIREHERLPNEHGMRGTEISVTILGNWSKYRPKILQYMRQMAVITPYARFEFAFRGPGGESDRGNFHLQFARRSDVIPKPPAVVKHHPSACNLLTVKQLADACPPSRSLCDFLTREFTSIGKPLARRLIAELGGDFDEHMGVGELVDSQFVRLTELLGKAKFSAPDGGCLSPVGEYNLRLGIIKELNPEYVATFSEPARVFEGHPFVVEAGVSIGERAGNKDIKTGINVYRFANRIPLLFEGGSDVATRVAAQLKWGQYKINVKDEKIGVFVSIVSTKIPFKGTSKEYIGEDTTSIRKAVDHALRQCCLQLKVKLAKRARMQQSASRKKTMLRYVPDASRAIMGVLAQIAEKRKRGDYEETGPVASRRRLGAAAAAAADKVDKGALSVEVLDKQLRLFVDKVDNEDVLEYVTQTGIKDAASRHRVVIQPLQLDRTYTETLYHPCMLMRLFSTAVVAPGTPHP